MLRTVRDLGPLALAFAAGLPLLTTSSFGKEAAGGRTWHVSQKELPGIGKGAELRTISQAAARAGPGETVVIHGGVYREKVVVEKSGTADGPITFRAAFGERVIVTGAELITEWRLEDRARHVYSAPWPHRFIGWNKTHAHPSDERHVLIGRSEQVFVNRYLLRQVLDRGKLARGTFHVDLDAKRLYVRSADGADLTNTGRSRVEASARSLVWRSKGDHIRVRGIRFRYAASMAQHGAVVIEGDGCVLEDCIAEDMNSIGAQFRNGRGMVVRRCVFRRNGQMGFSAVRAHGLVMTGCTVRDNNVKNWSRGWEAGGDKIVFCRGTVIEKSVFTENRGNGIWFDIGNEDCVVRNCLIADNEAAGIFYEISFALHAHDNVIVGNGFDAGPGAWGAAGGISISSSPRCVIERNIIVGNKEGFNYREQYRDTPLIADDQEKKTARPVWNHDQVVRANVLAFNRDAQVWGWFDIGDGRHWPRASRPALPAKERRPAEDIAAEYRAKGREGHPVGLTLEKLKLAHEGNLLFAAPGQGLFNWGVTWKHHRRYSGLEEVRRELSLESGSAVADPGFVDYLTRDFRVPPDRSSLRTGCYPKGDVPGARLGVLAGGP